jgi:hypothetical protein
VPRRDFPLAVRSCRAVPLGGAPRTRPVYRGERLIRDAEAAIRLQGRAGGAREPPARITVAPRSFLCGDRGSDRLWRRTFRRRTLRHKASRGWISLTGDAPLGRVAGDILTQAALPAWHEVGGCLAYPPRGRHPRVDVLGRVLGTTGKRRHGPVMRPCQAHATRGRSPSAPAG